MLSTSFIQSLAGVFCLQLSGAPSNIYLAPPPTPYDVATAVERTWYYSRGIDPDFADRLNDQQFENYPVDARAERCEWFDERAFRNRSGIFVTRPGYECIIMVYPNAEPAFRVPAFFHHDGREWIAVLAVREPLGLESHKFVKSPPVSTFSGAQGATAYDGLTGVDPDYDPYSDILGRED